MEQTSSNHFQCFLFARSQVLRVGHHLPEAGGDAAYLADPSSVEEIALGMKKIYSDKDLAGLMIEKGLRHAQKFTPQKSAESVMNVYKSIW